MLLIMIRSMVGIKYESKNHMNNPAIDLADETLISFMLAPNDSIQYGKDIPWRVQLTLAKRTRE